MAKVLVIGAGFAGHTAALYLGDALGRHHEITVMNRAERFVFIPSLGAFLAPNLLGGAKNFMIGSLIEEQFKKSLGNWPFGAAVSMILMTLVLIVLFVQARAATRQEVR